MVDRAVYQTPLVSRYTDVRMQEIWSDENKFRTWRRCWVALAESQHELGLAQVTRAYVDEMKRAAEEPIDYEFAEKEERRIRHDVMAHIHEFARHCSSAARIIHLGATSMEVCDNTYLIQMRQSMPIIRGGVVSVLRDLGDFALRNKDLACLSYTHYQPASPTTVGKRTTLYAHDLLYCLREIEGTEQVLSLARGVKGATGTQDTFLDLFGGDYERVKQLDRLFAKKLGFEGVHPVSGQTYTLKVDEIVLGALAGIGSSSHRFAVDLRLAANRKEMEEPFERDQVGSSAMPYKRNPVLAERLTGLSRKLMLRGIDPQFTHAAQFYERTLDDSVERRMNLPETFLVANAVLILYGNISRGLVVYPQVIRRHLEEELPFMASERILMEACRRGGDRQKTHELLRQHAQAAGMRVKQDGLPNDLLDRIAVDKDVPVDQAFLNSLLEDPIRFTGCASQQTEEFVREYIDPVVSKYANLISEGSVEVRV